MSSARRSTGGAVQDLVVGAASAVLAFAAVPGALAWFVGVPLPASWTRHAVLSLHGLFELLALVAWVAWAACAWPLLRSVATRVRARDARAGDGALPFGDRLALRIAAAVLVVVPLAGATSAATPAGAVTVRAPAASAAPSAPAGPGTVLGTVLASPVPDRPGQTAGAAQDAAVTVSPGDSLWTIAHAAYGDGGDWPVIARTNLGHLMAGATRFVDPNSVQTGWTLAIPSPQAEGQAAGPQRDPGRAGDRRGATVPEAPRHAVPDAPRHTHQPSPSRLLLPELAILGTGALVAALLARRARHARRLRSFVREEGDPDRRPSAAAADFGRAIGNFEDVPLLQWVELAMRAVASSRPIAGGTPLPPLRLVRAGSDGVEIRFASAPSAPRDPWVPCGPNAWILPASVDADALRAETRHHQPWTPVLLPLGEDDRGSWLLPLTAGSCLSVVGPAAKSLVTTMVAGATGWTWHEDVVVTGDPLAAAGALSPSVRRPDGSVSPRVLFTADPRSLPASARQRSAVLTLLPVADADVCVMVDDRAATVHPLGLTVRPHLLRAAWPGAVDEICTFEPGHARPPAVDRSANGHGPDDGTAADGKPANGPIDGWPGAAAPPSPAFREARPERATVRVRVAGGGDAATATSEEHWLERGTVEVRLLAPVPSVDGLADALPPKRARRAVELIAYLALHAPQPVTGDRLRTRVLGTADADAASKTLFNTVGAARRALGSEAGGDALLPPASRGGHYRLSPAVTVDARRCVALLTAGRATSDPGQRVAILHAGLSLVGGEPLSGVLSGYGWWRAEGHERRLADAVVDGACALGRTAVQTGQIDVGRWALEQARAVEPYSEALTRAAMGLAAAAGDARRLQLEWEACQRQVDELDPGGTPSQVTELLYARLRQHLRGGIGARADEPTAVLGV